MTGMKIWAQTSDTCTRRYT